MTLDDLRQLAYRVRGPRDQAVVRAALRADNYGTEWCVTDLLRLGDDTNTLLDVVAGIVKGRIDRSKMLDVPVELRTLDGQPLTIRRVWPEGDAPPRFIGADGVQHHTPNQWEPKASVLPADFRVAIADERWTQSAIWLLNKYGWHARESGRASRRYLERQARRGDQWKIVEIAFERLHPDLAPPGRTTTPAPMAGEVTTTVPPIEDVKERRRAAARVAAARHRAKRKLAAASPAE